MAGSAGALGDADVILENADSATPVGDTLVRVNTANMIAIQLDSALSGTVQLKGSTNYDGNIRPSNPVPSGELVDFKDPITLEPTGTIIHLADLPLSHVGLDLSGVVGTGRVDISVWEGGK